MFFGRAYYPEGEINSSLKFEADLNLKDPTIHIIFIPAL